MADLLTAAFKPLGGTIERLSLTSQKKPALRIRKHPQAPRSVLLAGHLDTVYGINHPFQKMEITEQRLFGPGVADMKGGLLVMLRALEYLESSPVAGQLGWEVLINPDEEIGSLGSKELFAEAAKRHLLGLVYEPAFPDGSLVSSRKGSVNYTLISKGRSAHAGRDFHHGRNAIAALARCVSYIDSLSKVEEGTTVNVAHFESLFPSNIVPDHATSRINVRAKTSAHLAEIEILIQKIAKEESKDGIVIEVHHDSASPPKPFDESQQYLYHAIQETGSALGMSLSLKESGGTCDGARLYAYGLPNMDSMGVVGGGLHTADEYCETDSIIERAALSSLFLMNLASGDLKLDFKEKVK